VVTQDHRPGGACAAQAAPWNGEILPGGGFSSRASAPNDYPDYKPAPFIVFRLSGAST
jgi:hypothetical protein